MKFEYQLFTDSSVDMLPEFAAENEIEIIPMSYTLGEDEYFCDHVETDEERTRFYNAQREGKVTKTSQTNIQSCTDAFTKCAKEGRSMLCVSLSAGLSGNYNSACIAAEAVMADYPGIDIQVVDSRSATGGVDILLELAAKNRAAGMTPAENAESLNAIKMRIQHWFMVDDLMFLKRGGRVSAASAMIGTALNIKPVLKIEADGTLAVFAKKRGAKQTLSYLTQLYQECSDKAAGEIIWIAHGGAPDYAEFVKEKVLALNPQADIRVCQLTPVIGAHTGPGLCALIHVSRPGTERK